MIATVLLILVSQSLNAEPIKQSTQWYECLLSYRQAAGVLLDVSYNEKANKNQLIFRNGKYLPPEALNIFHNGQFWTTELKIIDGFYDKKIAIVTLGSEKFCLTYDFNWIHRDNLMLTPYTEKTCTAMTTIAMSVAQTEAAPSVEDVLFTKIKNDVMRGLNCLSNRPEEPCADLTKSQRYTRLVNWNTQACEKIENEKLKKLIADKKKIVSEYSTQLAPAGPATPPKQKAKPPVRTRT